MTTVTALLSCRVIHVGRHTVGMYYDDGARCAVAGVRGRFSENTGALGRCAIYDLHAMGRGPRFDVMCGQVLQTS